MANLGIIIAVSEYTRDAKSLRACEYDGAAVGEILRLSGRIDDILNISSGTESALVKQRLAEFVKNHKSQKIEEVLFYFTGHGEFEDDEFYYLLTDYQQKRLKQTSLENTELDNLIRSLNPDLFVKIVDACHSGVTYIKSPETFERYVKSPGAGFKSLYFMFSSQTDQFSYQNDLISYFTESVLRAILACSATTVRYKDIIDSVSDWFKVLDFQTPLFVTQADFTEVLCEVTQTLKEALMPYIQVEEEDRLAPMTPEKAVSIADRLKDDSRRFCSKDEAITVLESIPNSLERVLRNNTELGQLYDLSLERQKVLPLSCEKIGQWLEKNRAERGYFAQHTTEVRTTRVRVARNRFLGMLGPTFGDDDDAYKWVDQNVSVVSGLKATFEMPFSEINIKLTPQLPNITPEECLVVPILSRTHIRLFWSFSHFEYVDWNESRKVGPVDWATDEAPLKDAESIQSLADSVAQKFWTFVEEPLRVKWGTEPSGSKP